MRSDWLCSAAIKQRQTAAQLRHSGLNVLIAKEKKGCSEASIHPAVLNFGFRCEAAAWGCYLGHSGVLDADGRVLNPLESKQLHDVHGLLSGR